MDNENHQNQLLEQIKHANQEGAEFWSARELQLALGYSSWERFQNVIKKAKQSFESSPTTSNQNINDHFHQVVKMVTIGSNAQKSTTDYQLSRYACYLIAQNGDARKEPIAFAQSYFAIQTRRQEIHDQTERQRARLEAREKYSESDKKLSSIVGRRDITSTQLAAIKSNGDKVLFGGNTTKQMKEKYGLDPKTSKPLADVLPTISLTAKQLANEMTYINTERNDLVGFHPINQEHKDNNQTIRASLGQRGIKLEDLPPETDIKVIRKQMQHLDQDDQRKIEEHHE